MIRMFLNTLIYAMHSDSDLYQEIAKRNAIIQTENIAGDQKRNLMVEFIDYDKGQTLSSLVPFYKNIKQKKEVNK